MVYTRFNSYVFVLRTNLEPNGGEDRVVKKKKSIEPLSFVESTEQVFSSPSSFFLSS